MTDPGAVPHDIPCSTTFEVPGLTVERSVGLCFGLIVRSVGFAVDSSGEATSRLGGRMAALAASSCSQLGKAGTSSASSPGPPPTRRSDDGPTRSSPRLHRGHQSLKSGEVTESTDVVEEARRHALEHLVAQPQQLGNAVVGVRFDSSDVGAYGAPPW